MLTFARSPAPCAAKSPTAAASRFFASAANGLRSMTALSASIFCKYGAAASAAASKRPKAARYSTSSEMSVKRRICWSRSSTGKREQSAFLGVHQQRDQEAIAPILVGIDGFRSTQPIYVVLANDSRSAL